MNKYLIEILKIQSSVILPGLGALMVPSQKSGNIVFNQHLKFNDGSFARFIAEKEGIDEQEAQNKVAKFVREIEAELGKGNSYDMFEFGKFYKKEDGQIDFKMFKNGTEKEEVKASEPVEEKKKSPKVTPAEIIADKTSNSDSAKEDEKKKKDEDKKAKAELKAAEAKKAAEEEAAVLARKAEEEAKEAEKAKKAAEALALEAKKKEEEAKAALREEEEKIAQAALLAAAAVSDKSTENPVEEKTNTPTEKEVNESQKDEKINLDKQRKNIYTPPVAASSEKEAEAINEKKTEDLTPPPPPPAADPIEEKKKRNKWPLIILLLLLIGLAVVGYFFKDQILNFFNGEHKTEVTSDSTNANEVESQQDEPNASDTLAQEMDMDSTEFVEEEVITTPEEEVIEADAEEPAPVVNTGTNNGSYHLIGNSFGEKENANRYLEKMQEKGYPAKIIGRYDGLYLVSLKSYDSRQAAESGRSTVSADAGSAWVFHKQ